MNSWFMLKAGESPWVIDGMNMVNPQAIRSEL